MQTLRVIISYMIHNMQVGIDSFAAWDNKNSSLNPSERLRKLVEQIEFADKIGLDVFGIGEHHRKEFLDSSFLEQPQHERDAYV